MHHSFLLQEYSLKLECYEERGWMKNHYIMKKSAWKEKKAPSLFHTLFLETSFSKMKKKIYAENNFFSFTISQIAMTSARRFSDELQP
jgi:hypothetical protein